MNATRPITLRQIASIVGVCAALCALLGIGLLLTLADRFRDQLLNITTYHQVVTRAAAEMELHVNEIGLKALVYTSSPDADLLTRIGRGQTNFRNALEDYELASQRAGVAHRAEELRELFRNYEADVAMLLRSSDLERRSRTSVGGLPSRSAADSPTSPDAAVTVRLGIEQLATRRRMLDDLIGTKVRPDLTAGFEVATQKLDRAHGWVRAFALGLFVAVAALLFGCWRLLKRFVLDPLTQLLAALARIRNTDDLTTQISVHGVREVQRVAQGLNQMAKELHSNVVDKNELVVANSSLQHLALHDPLTGLSNRLGLERHLNALISSEQIASFALLYIDLDGFKQINDSMGHRAGDVILREVADRLSSAVGGTGFLSRMGGDEFTATIADVLTQQDAVNAVRKIRECLAKPHAIDGREFFVTAAIGVSLHPRDAASSTELLQAADLALYQAKSEGEGRECLYEVEMSNFASRRVRLRSQLNRAIARGELTLLFHPIIAIDDGRLCGAEALLRWNNAEFGEVSPDEFIPLCEDSGLILPIGEWVLGQSLAVARQLAGMGRQLRISVNVSMQQLAEQGFTDSALALLRDGEGELLEFEITESQLMRDPDRTIRTLDRFRSHGIAIAVDDFGTGHSSLALLKQLPLDRLKIDRSFVESLKSDDDDASIIRAILAVAKSLGLKVTAEGVETTRQLQALKREGCEFYQGFYASRPLTASKLIDYATTKAMTSDT
jgi:diguanylate cyclase (GGDEF)-like protein